MTASFMRPRAHHWHYTNKRFIVLLTKMGLSQPLSWYSIILCPKTVEHGHNNAINRYIKVKITGGGGGKSGINV